MAPRRTSRLAALFAALAIFVVASILLSIVSGAESLTIAQVYDALMMRSTKTPVTTIIWEIRLPRIALGLVVGAGLAACGAVLQGMLRNPLACPYTLGISGGAAFGATLSIVLGIHTALGYFSQAASAFVGSLLAMLILLLLARARDFSISALILGGVMINFVFSGLVLLVLSISRAHEAQSALFWLMGFLDQAPSRVVLVVGLPVCLGTTVLWLLGRPLDVLTLGEEKAISLGVRPATLKVLLLITASLITAFSVSAAGIIGFVGLLVPHFMRPSTGPGHRMLIPAAALAGGGFLVLTDTIARTIAAPKEIPVGVITGLLGGAVFLFFLLRSERWQSTG